jgi:hypothetical protein
MGTHGTVTLSAGQITYTPDADYFGPASFTYTITDNGTTNGAADPRTATGTVTLTVNAVNDAPVAFDDTATTAEDTAKTFTQAALKGNDTDVDNANAELSVTVVDNATNGTVVLNANGTVTFTPAADFFGTAGFDYTVSDGDKTDVGHVTITVTAINDAPVTTKGADKSGNENDTIQVSASFTDVDTSDTHTCYINWGDGSGNSSGTVAEPTGTAAGSCTGSHQYLDDNPTATSADDYQVTITVKDSGTPQKSNSAQVKVTIRNLAPTASNPLTPFTYDPVTGQATANVNIADTGTKDTLTVSFEWIVDGVSTIKSVNDTEANGTGTATSSHQIGRGCHAVTVKATVTDDDSGAVTHTIVSSTQQVVDVYQVGFQAPIKDNERNLAKAGNVVPVKVSLISSCTGVAITSPTLYIVLVKGANPTEYTAGDEIIPVSVSAADTGNRLIRSRYALDRQVAR